jgi:hypothetical protein
MTERANARTQNAEKREPPRRRRNAPARGILIGLAIATPCWLAIGYAIHLLLPRI